MNDDTVRLARLGLAAILVVATLGNPSNTKGAGYTPFEGEKTAWHGGFDRYDFVMDEANSGRRALQARRG